MANRTSIDARSLESTSFGGGKQIARPGIEIWGESNGQPFKLWIPAKEAVEFSEKLKQTLALAGITKSS